MLRGLFADPDLEALLTAWLSPEGEAPEEREALLASVAPRLSAEARASLWALASAGPAYGTGGEPEARAAREAGAALWRLCAGVAERRKDAWTLAQASHQVALLEREPARASQARERALTAALEAGEHAPREALGDLLASLLDGLEPPLSRARWAMRWRDAAALWGDRLALAQACRALGTALWAGADVQEAASVLEQAASLFEECEEPSAQAGVRLLALEVAFAAGDAVAAVKQLTALARVRERLDADETELCRAIDALLPSDA